MILANDFFRNSNLKFIIVVRIFLCIFSANVEFKGCLSFENLLQLVEVCFFFKDYNYFFHVYSLIHHHQYNLVSSCALTRFYSYTVLSRRSTMYSNCTSRYIHFCQSQAIKCYQWKSSTLTTAMARVLVSLCTERK